MVYIASRLVAAFLVIGLGSALINENVVDGPGTEPDAVIESATETSLVTEPIAESTTLPPPIGGCTHPWKSLLGVEGLCYLFSELVMPGLNPQTFNGARLHCQQAKGDLATAGQFSASVADPLLKYFRERNLATAWVGASRVASSWKWVDNRSLSVFSNLWLPAEPSGDGDCVHLVRNDYRKGYLNDINCSSHQHFVCARPKIDNKK